MSTLHNLQKRCLDAFVYGNAEAAVADILPSAMPQKSRVAVYANNVREGRRKTLLSAYPVLAKLVGDDCFRGLAWRYGQNCPSRSGDLQNFGASFADLLEAEYGTTQYRYLTDVARLEWQIERALLRAPSPVLELSALAAVDASQHADLRFTVNSPDGLLASRYPILAIWKANQTDNPAPVDLDSGPQYLAVCRDDNDAALRELDNHAYALAQCLASGQSLIESSESLADQPGFDLAASLSTLMANGCLGGFTTGAQKTTN